jgi:putative chitinase
MFLDKQKFLREFKPYFKQITGKNLTARQETALLRLVDELSHWEDLRCQAYALATVHVETFIPKGNYRYEPVTEFGGQRYFHKYDVGRLAKQLGNTPEADGDGFKYRGRGFVQLTGRRNYQKADKHLQDAGLCGGLIRNPDIALEPDIAFEIMDWGMVNGIFTGKTLSDYFNDKKTDYKGARRIINGQDRAAEIAEYAVNFERILRSSILESPTVATTSPDEPASILPLAQNDEDTNPPQTTTPIFSLETATTKAQDIFGRLSQVESSVSGSSWATTILTKFSGYALSALGVISANPIYLIVGAGLILGGLAYLHYSKQRGMAKAPLRPLAFLSK